MLLLTFIASVLYMGSYCDLTAQDVEALASPLDCPKIGASNPEAASPSPEPVSAVKQDRPDAAPQNFSLESTSIDAPGTPTFSLTGPDVTNPFAHPSPRFLAIGSDGYLLHRVLGDEKIVLHNDQLLVLFDIHEPMTVELHAEGSTPILGSPIGDGIYRFCVSQVLAIGINHVRLNVGFETPAIGMNAETIPLELDYQPVTDLVSIRNENAQRRHFLSSIFRQRNEFSTTSLEFFKSFLCNQSGPYDVCCPYNELDTIFRRNSESQVQAHGLVPHVERSVPFGFLGITLNAQVSLDYTVTKKEPQTRPSIFGATGSEIATMAKISEEDLSLVEDQMAQAENVWKTRKIVSRVQFKSPAVFTRTEYARSAQEVPQTGMVLLEGMELTATGDGHWELTIPYLEPKTPTTLHLQIQLTSDGRTWYPITIQPIRIESYTTSDLDETASSSNGKPIVCKGFSPMLRDANGLILQARRRGFAEFGYGFSAIRETSRY